MWLQKQPLVSCSRAGKLQVPLLRVLAAWLMNRGKEWSLFFGTTWGMRCYKDYTDGQFLSVYHYCSKCFMNLICFILTNALREKVTIIFLSVRKPGKHDVCTLLKITQQGGCGHSTDSSHTTPETWDCGPEKDSDLMSALRLTCLSVSMTTRWDGSWNRRTSRWEPGGAASLWQG